MADSTDSRLRPNFSKELDIESIISAPLAAASKANIVMITGQTRFLLEYCFAKEENSKTYKPVMIEMQMMKAELVSGTEPGEPDTVKHHKLSFGLPLLTLIPINSLVIDKVTVDFDMEITSVTSYEPTGKLGDRKVPLTKQAQLYGKISSDPYDRNNKTVQNKSQSKSRLKVNINASPLPLPVGVLTVIDLYTKAIQPLPEQPVSTTKPKQHEEK